MTPEEFTRRMHVIYTDCEWDKQYLGGDAEGSHQAADALMCEFLRDAGCGEAVDLFEDATRWYA